jgi:hypothetical protein
MISKRPHRLFDPFRRFGGTHGAASRAAFRSGSAGFDGTRKVLTGAFAPPAFSVAISFDGMFRDRDANPLSNEGALFFDRRGQ